MQVVFFWQKLRVIQILYMWQNLCYIICATPEDIWSPSFIFHIIPWFITNSRRRIYLYIIFRLGYVKYLWHVYLFTVNELILKQRGKLEEKKIKLEHVSVFKGHVGYCQPLVSWCLFAVNFSFFLLFLRTSLLTLDISMLQLFAIYQVTTIHSRTIILLWISVLFGFSRFIFDIRNARVVIL
jgi:hypothetical protein